MAFYQRWLCRLDPWPDHLMRTFTGLREEIYGAMWGTEWNITGNLKDWDVTARLGELDVPVLHHLRSPRPHDPRRGPPDRRRHPRRRVGRLRAQRARASIEESERFRPGPRVLPQQSGSS